MDTQSCNELSSLQIKQMMANAQKEIEERKRKLLKVQSNNMPSLLSRNIPLLDAERANKIKILQDQIKAKIGAVPLPPIQHKPTALILNAEGRTLVDYSGREVCVPTFQPTLKANLRAKKREASKNNLHAKNQFENVDDRFHDDRLSVTNKKRNKRTLRFHEPGKFQIMGERLRMSAQLEKLQAEISQIARKTGISSATKLALIAPKTDSHSDSTPNMEWWDSVILSHDLNTVDKNGHILIRSLAITNLIEHPTQMRPPNETLRPIYLPVFLTKKEKKKLRRQNRREQWKDQQEQIRLGLIEPPQPKLRISNLMRVLGTEAVQDPTKIEAHVREQMAKRQKLHEDTNKSRKLTIEQKREKKIRKIKEDVSSGVHVSVYRIKDLHTNASKKFKVETNAKQLLMTGIVVLFRDCCVVVVEGGPKQQKKFRRLMMHRIKWEEDVLKDGDGKDIPNSCVLVWEGISSRRNFGELKFKSVLNEKTARDLFQKHHVEHYWDLCFSEAVLEC